MNVFRLAALLALGFGLSACASVDTATRNAPLDNAISQSVPVSLDIQDSPGDGAQVAEGVRGEPLLPRW